MYIRETVESDLQHVLAKKQNSLRATLRKMSPFLSNEALDKMLHNASNATREGMEQAYVIAITYLEATS